MFQFLPGQNLVMCIITQADHVLRAEITELKTVYTTTATTTATTTTTSKIRLSVARSPP